MPNEFASQRRHLVAIAIALAAMFTLALGWAVWRVIREQTAARNWVDHTRDVVERVDRLLATVQTAEAAERGFVVTGNESYADACRRAAEESPAQIARLGELTSDNSEQQARVALLRGLVVRRLEEMQDVIRLRRERGFEAASQGITNSRGNRTMTAIRSTLQQMRDEEGRLLHVRRGAAAEIRTLLYSIVAGLIALAAVLIATIVSMVYWIKRLQAGLVTMCAWTRQVKYDDRWMPVEEYLERRFGIRVSHGISDQAAREFNAPESGAKSGTSAPPRPPA